MNQDTPEESGHFTMPPLPEEHQHSFAPMPQPQRKPMPPALLVLCILTLVGSTVGIFLSIFNALVTGLLGTQISLSVVTNAYGGILFILTLLGVAFAIIKIFSAILMLNRRKAGLYLYTGAELLAAANLLVSRSMIFLFSRDYLPGSRTPASFLNTITFAVFFTMCSVLFLVMYWLQRKHLR